MSNTNGGVDHFWNQLTMRSTTENVQTAGEALARLEEPFASKDVKWLVAATSRDDRKGRATPYASTSPAKR